MIMVNNMAAIPVKALWLTLDIETGYAPPEAIESMIAGWEPPKNIKDESKIQERKEVFLIEAKSKSALTDAAPIISVAIKTNTGLRFIFSAMGKGKAVNKIENWQLIESDTEADMLLLLSTTLNTLCDETTRLVGHNIIGFDLPKLRNRLVRHKIKLPSCLTPRFSDVESNQPVYDTMKAAKYFSQELSGCPFVSFKDLAKALGLSIHKDIADGSKIPMLHEQGLIDTILSYNALDVEFEEEAFLMMTAA